MSAWTFPVPGGARYFGRGVWLTGDVNGDRFWDVSTDALIDYIACEYEIYLFGGSAMGVSPGVTTRVTLSSSSCSGSDV
jgi:hypothetical protein